MNNSLMISNVYAAYTAGSDKSGHNVSELSKMLKSSAGEKITETAETNGESMDKVIISKEALERLSGLTSASK